MPHMAAMASQTLCNAGAAHHISALVVARLILALGKPEAECAKYHASVEVAADTETQSGSYLALLLFFLPKGRTKLSSAPIPFATAPF
jgi:hypothetical protein